VVWEAPTAYIVRLRWRPRDEGADRVLFQVLRLRDGQIVEIADYHALGPATRTAKRFAGLTAA
jgi:hypothetical protein